MSLKDSNLVTGQSSSFDGTHSDQNDVLARITAQTLDRTNHFNQIAEMPNTEIQYLCGNGPREEPDNQVASLMQTASTASGVKSL